MNKALSLKQAAELLGVSYSSMFKNRKEIGFRLPNTKKWLVWRSTLENMGKPAQNDDSFAQVGTNGEAKCQSTNVKIPMSGGLISQRQAAKELESLLKQRTEGKLKSTMIGLKSNIGKLKD